ncbi:A/G-specific adenine glycosylase [Patescibacteria group bacterium]|nr:A/G-specific adenine glycosylase [Patescibacteria group bacterium]
MVKGSSGNIRDFQRIVWKYYEKEGRHDLPWRKTTDPYKILVSEVMLQQTQVDRVKPFYKEFLKKFPTVHALAKASLGDVLKEWQGLGYNRRAKMLHEAAKQIVSEYKGKLPDSVEELESLRGVGPYTARAVATFAYNLDVVCIETNVRTVITHHFFHDQKEVADKDILAILAKALPKGNAREWYSALMDYGAHLKRSGVRNNTKSTTYTKQSTFAGSNREVRGAILRALISGPQTVAQLSRLLGHDRKDQIKIQIQRLESEHLIQKNGSHFRLPH